MDPNAALKEIVELLNAPTFDGAVSDRLRELCNGLYEWLDRDGFMPGGKPAEWPPTTPVANREEPVSLTLTRHGLRNLCDLIGYAVRELLDDAD